VRPLEHFHAHIAVLGSHGVEMREMCQYFHRVILIMHAFQKLIASAANIVGKASVVKGDFPIIKQGVVCIG
jgi:hypothetical protein